MVGRFRRDAASPGCWSRFRDLLHPVFLANTALAQEVDLDPVFGRQSFGVLPKRVPERLGELRVVEDPNLPLVQLRGHPLGVEVPHLNFGMIGKARNRLQVG